MSTNDKKPWDRPWTTQEMIDNASNWNLAGDAGLLKYLEEFSDKMLTKVKDTNERLNDLIDSAEETSLALNNATNQFMGLRNTQFIESRVYDDDETLPVKNTEKEEKPKPTEAERLEEMKQAIVNGLDIIDKYYEKVEIPESDSEDDSSEPNIVYKPVDPYIDRPLPYVIGTAEWHKYWHVGLGHSSSDSEVENDDEQFSESESEQDAQVLPSRDRPQIPGLSDSESEDYSKNKMSRPVANSTFNDQTTKNMFDSSSDSETGSLPPQVNTVNSNFAEELAAKLGKMESSNIEVEVNTKPIQKPKTNIPGGLFSDEPPPLDEVDIFVPKHVASDLFSGGNGLFDDDNDNDFWNTKPISDPVKKSVDSKMLFAEDNEESNIFNNKSNIIPEDELKPKIQQQQQKQTIKKPSSLFDDDCNEDDDIFNTSSLAQPTRKTNAAAPVVSEQPPDLEQKQQINEDIKRRKPIGGVSVLRPDDLLGSKIFIKRAPSSSESDHSDKEPVQTAAVQEEPKKLPSLFDDSSPLFSDDIFGSAAATTKAFSSKLFDSSVEEPLFKQKEPETTAKLEEDLLRNEPPPLPQKDDMKTSSIFDDDDDDDFQNDLFSNKASAGPKIPDITSTTTRQSKSLSLFDDNHSDEDLFASLTNKKSHHSLFDPNPPALNPRKPKSVNLFDPNPPELDETDNNKSDPLSYGSMNAGRAFLYDTEPPMLSNESSGIARDQSTRLESEDSSFYPFLTSSRRHSDIFQETQTADSLLTTRNKMSFGADSTGKSNLSGIPEYDTITKIDITPSGNESSLNDTSSISKTNSSSAQENIKPNIAKKPPNLLHEQNTSNTYNEEDNSVFVSNISAENSTNKPMIGKKPSDIIVKEEIPSNISANVEDTNEKKKKLNISSEETNKPTLFIEEDRSVFKSNTSIEKEEKPNITSEEINKPNIAKKPTLFNEKNKNLFVDSDSDDDLFSNKSSGSKNSSTSDINTSAAKPFNIKTKNIFENDLFSGPNLKVDKNHVFSNINVDSKNKENDNKKFNYEENLKSDEDIKVDPKKSLNFEKSNNKEEEPDGEVLSSGSSPGKLKHNLNINLAALLPGASPPRKQHLEKSISLDSSESPNQSSTEEPSKKPLVIKSAEPKLTLEKSLSFESPIEHNEILPSAAKERAKIPVKRRPSSRRARQEAIRKSVADLKLEDAILENKTENILNIANNNNVTEEKPQNIEEKMKNPLLNPLSPSTDEEDLLTMPTEKDVSDNFTEDSLFGKAPIISPVHILSTKEFAKSDEKPNITNEDLFDILNVPAQHSDLFATDVDVSATEKKTDLFSSSTQAKIKIADTSIFSSSDSENDLFSTPKSKSATTKTPDNNNILSSPDEDLFKPMTSSYSAKGDTKPASSNVSLPEDLFQSDDIFSAKKLQPKSIVPKKSLFDDDDDIDDIFGSSRSSVPKSTTTSAAVAAPPSGAIKKSSINKLKKMPVDAIEDILDPLEALKK